MAVLAWPLAPEVLLPRQTLRRTGAGCRRAMVAVPRLFFPSTRAPQVDFRWPPVRHYGATVPKLKLVGGTHSRAQSHGRGTPILEGRAEACAADVQDPRPPNSSA